MTLQTVTLQAPTSMEFSRQEYWGELPFPSPRIFLTQGLSPSLLHYRQILYCLSHEGSSLPFIYTSKHIQGTQIVLYNICNIKIPKSKFLTSKSLFLLIFYVCHMYVLWLNSTVLSNSEIWAKGDSSIMVFLQQIANGLSLYIFCSKMKMYDLYNQTMKINVFKKKSLFFT